MALAADEDDTPGEFLDQGAKPLAPEQVKKIYSGRKQSGEISWNALAAYNKLEQLLRDGADRAGQRSQPGNAKQALKSFSHAP